MLEQKLGFSLARFAAVAALLAAVAGCNPAETSGHGAIDIVPSGLRAAACDPAVSGHLQLDGLLVADVMTVSAHELCHNWVVRKELPAGLYTVSWQPSDAGSDGSSTADEPRYEIRDGEIVNVFPEQTTTLRVLRVEPEPAELPTQALLEGGAQ